MTTQEVDRSMNKNLVSINFVLVPHDIGYMVRAYRTNGTLLEERYCEITEVAETTGDICRAEMLAVNDQ